jgi:hypothetical protein
MLIRVVVDVQKDPTQSSPSNEHTLQVISVQRLGQEIMKQILTGALENVSKENPFIIEGEEAIKAATVIPEVSEIYQAMRDRSKEC